MHHQGLASAFSERWKCERWNGYGFALRHLALAVSHALISLTYGCNMEVFSSFGI